MFFFNHNSVMPTTEDGKEENYMYCTGVLGIPIMGYVVTWHYECTCSWKTQQIDIHVHVHVYCCLVPIKLTRNTEV